MYIRPADIASCFSF
ncbi:hypothetical protein D047_0385A, partial [Vibrio parahaemolyticus VPTS-2010_2]